MGNNYSLHCDNCGYHTGSLHDGIGMTGHRYAIVQCGDCHNLSSVHLKEQFIPFDEPLDKYLIGLSCRYCRSSNIKECCVNEAEKNLCPKCGGLSMSAKLIYEWD